MPPYRPERQVHDWHEVLVPTSGSYCLRLDDGAELAGAVGSAIVVPAGTWHTPLIRVGDPLQLYCCMWWPDGVDIGSIRRLEDTDGRLLGCCSWMWDLSYAHYRDRERPEPVRRQLALLIELLATTIASHETSDCTDRAVARVVDHLRINLAEQNRIADLARMVGLGTDALIRRFRRVTGYTPGAYLQRLRVEKAIALLRATDLSLTEVAGAVGWSSCSHLSSTILRHTGRRPVSFKRRRA